MWTANTLDGVKADACLQCGHCDGRCLFSVKQMSRMIEIEKFFDPNKVN